MAKLSSDGKYVTVESGDTLTQIAVDYAGGYSNYKKLAAINGIQNPDLIYIGQQIYLVEGGSSGSGSSSSSAQSNKVTITAFGALASDPNTLFAMWTWDKENQTEKYRQLWKYTTLDGIEFVGNSSDINVDELYYQTSRQTTYQIPTGATSVSFYVKPVSKTFKQNDQDATYWTADWSTKQYYEVGTALEAPATPKLEADKFKLTASIENVSNLPVIKGETPKVQFQLVKNNDTVVGTSKDVAVNANTGYVSYVWETADAGSEYKTRARFVLNKLSSEWSGYSGSVTTPPSVPAGFTVAKAQSETSAYFEWDEIKSAKTYDIEYTTEKRYFDNADQTTIKTGIENTHYEITGLESGKVYFFRLRAVNEDNTRSGWSEISSVVIGSKPAAPTTWSSSTTAVVGEPLNLYWVHNAEDGSSQTYAELELYINDVKETHTIKNSTEKEEKDRTSVFPVDTSVYSEGVQIQWRVRTAGVTNEYGDWSVQRTVDIYAKPALELSFTDINGKSIETLTAFPGYIHALPGPKTQAPIGYHVEVIANDIYETVDNVGNTVTISSGDAVYSKHFDIDTDLLVELSSSNIDLENNISYTIKCTVSMNSGLTTESSVIFTVAWTDERYSPNAEISIDKDTLSAHIRPYCMEHIRKYYKVTLFGNVYTKTDEVLGSVYGEQTLYTTSSGETVYYGVDGSGADIYYCIVNESHIVENIKLSVYRRTYDGKFVEISTGLDNSKNTTVTDPHPSLDYARYRIVATSTETGAISYTDVTESIGHIFAVIQWAEKWSNFNVTNEDAIEQPAWSGSLLELKYNLDVSESNNPDIAHVDYIGREQSVSYFGTKIGNKTIWNADIEKGDKDTLYALRRLQRWMGNIYVREPSGLGYWATASVSFNQSHNGLTIPVTINLTRVEGGV